MAEWRGWHSKPVAHMTPNELMKREGLPHIRKWGGDKAMHACRGCGHIGIGLTPREAWEVWNFNYRNGGGCR